MFGLAPVQPRFDIKASIIKKTQLTFKIVAKNLREIKLLVIAKKRNNAIGC